MTPVSREYRGMLRHLPTIAIALGSFALLLIGLPDAARAQRVEQMRGDRVLIQTDQLKFAIGQKWEAIDGNGDIVGTIEIKNLRGDKAVGAVIQGEAVKGANLRLKEDLKVLTEEEKVRTRKWFIGLSTLAAQVKIRTPDTDTETDLVGGQWGVQAGADQVLTAHQTLRLRAGFDLIRARSDINNLTDCGGDRECNLWTHYATASLGFNFQLMPEGSSWNTGISTAFTGFLPLSRESDALDASKLGLDGGFEAGAFINLKTNPITWMEVSVQRIFLRDTERVRPQLIRFNFTWIQNF